MHSIMHIHGGFIAIDASVDRVDSNGNVDVTGSTLLVHGPPSGYEGPLTVNFTITGGLVVAVGFQEFAQTMDDVTSTQYLV